MQLVSIAIPAFAFYLLFSKAYSEHVGAQTKVQKLLLGFVCPFLLVGIMMLLATFLEMFLLKPSFAYARPATQLTDSFVARHILSHGMRSATPSGFVLRQVIVLFSFLVLSFQGKWKEVVSSKRGWKNTLLHFSNYAFFLLVIFLRTYRAQHTLYDVGLAIGLGTLIFWSLAVIGSFLIHREKAVKHARYFFLPAFTYLLVFLLYTQETTYWIIFSTILLILLASLNILACRVRTEREDN